jgi:hypothetical protein
MTADWSLLLGPLGLTVAVIVVLGLNISGVWISGREHRAALALMDQQLLTMTEDRDYWKQFGMGLLDIQERQADASVSIAKTVRPARKGTA